MHARNRWLAPGQGRWLQADPNASALVLIGSGAHSGRELTALVASLDLSSLTGDGVNLYGYVRSKPLRASDPLGLYMSPLDTLSIGMRVGTEAAALIANYAFDLELDADWASDWSAKDDLYSRARPNVPEPDIEDVDLGLDSSPLPVASASFVLRATATAIRAGPTAPSCCLTCITSSRSSSEAWRRTWGPDTS